ncbi:Thymus-specific serine protease [Grifola frondosa]|uniref:Thymus-specific serine protease n=1 Tax=Grifola frondosa TaxID=5627 RepID=A0A1C7MB05_GRIFR|nr:Thymus-specific serine protease [Grifola frondosa]
MLVLWTAGFLLPVIYAFKTPTSQLSEYLPALKREDADANSALFFYLPIDHFGGTSGTFKNRYWINDTYYVQGGPVFFFDSGEQNAEPLLPYYLQEYHGLSATMQLAKRYKGLAILWEHRYYGDSLPFPVNENTTAEQWQFLTTDQALEDVVYFANSFMLNSSKIARPASNVSTGSVISPIHPSVTPWIWLGGSYPGVRGAFLRVRNPSTIYAVWASSAPVHAQVDMAAYYKAAERSLTRNCSADWVAVTRFVDDTLESGSAEQVTDMKFRLLKARADGPGGNETGSEGLTKQIAANASNVEAAGVLMDPLSFYQYYGFEASLLPFCNNLETQNFTASPLEFGVVSTHGVGAAFGAFLTAISELNYDEIPGNADDPVQDRSWMWQYCSEYGFYQRGDPNNPLSIETSFRSLERFQQECNEAFPNGLPPSPRVSNVNKYGGWNMTPSNVFFTNGEFDPWRTMGLASIEPESPQRTPDVSIPACNTAPAFPSFFGMTHARMVHVSDLRVLLTPDANHSDFKTVGFYSPIAQEPFYSGLALAYFWYSVSLNDLPDCPTVEPPTTKEFKFDVNLASEDSMYDGICKGLQDSLPDEQGLVVNHTIRWHDSTDHFMDTQSKDHKNPDVGIYPRHEDALKALAMKKPFMKKRRADHGGRVPVFGRVAWDWLFLPVEIKHKEKTAPFAYDDNGYWLLDNDEARRYARMTPVERGFDPTATLATKEEIAILKAYIASLKDRDVSEYLRECMDNIISKGRTRGKDRKRKNRKDDKDDTTNYGWPIYKIELDANKFMSVKKGGSEWENSDQASEDDTAANIDPHPGAKRYLLIGRRSYDMTEKTHVFLKDTWRPDSPHIHAEGEIYTELAKHEVTNIATLLYCGDVGGGTPQTTRTQELLKKVNTDVKILPRIHYRLIFEEIARPLHKYHNSCEMARAIYAALTAHKEAWEKGGILHRDVSDGNIMICDDVKDEYGQRTSTAFLNDWDLAKYKHELAKTPMQKTRSGTWQFISAALLRFPQKQHEVSDDIESFIHVINWLSFLVSQGHDSDKPEDLGNMLDDIYDQCTHTPDGYDTGGGWKLLQIKSGDPPMRLEGPSQGHLALLQSLALLAKKHYESVSLSQWDDVDNSSSSSALDAGNDKKPIAEPVKKVTTIKVEAKRAFHQFIPKPVDTNQADVNPMPVTPPTPINREGVLSSHNAILAAFEDGLGSKIWKLVDKTKNFVKIQTNSGTFLCTKTGSGRRGAQSASSGGVESDERPAKRRRPGKRSKRAQAASKQNDEGNMSAVSESEEED